MFKNYFKIAWRNVIGSKFFSAINIGGLAVGMAVATLIGFWIWDELSYDKYNRNYNRIAEVMQQTTINGEAYTNYPSPIALADELRNSYGSEFKHVVLSWWNREHTLTFENNGFTRTGKFMEPAAAELLSLNMLKGNRAGLNEPSSILLSASTAKTIFGDTDPVNRTIIIDNKLNVKVTGVYENIPYNSKFRDVAFIAPWELFVSSDDLMKAVKTNWGYDAAEIFVQLADNADIKKVSAKIRNSKLNRIKDDKELVVYKPAILLQPMSRWHLYAEWKNGINTGGKIQFVWLFGLVGLFVLLLACINFMNLSTARSEKRAKEVGLRKAVGSLRNQLISQFLTESFLIAATAFVFSLLLIQIVLPFFNEVADKNISVPWNNLWFWLGGIGFSIFTGIIAGSYPAFYLSSFEPVKVLKGTFKVGRFASSPMKALMVLQFTVSVMLIIGTIVVFEQIQYAKDRPIGYSRDGLIQLQIDNPELYGNLEALRNDLLKTGTVTEMAESSSPATWLWSNRSGFDWHGKDPSLQTEFGAITVTRDYGKTVGWQLKEGRDFSKEFSTDSSALILNEAAVKFMGLKNPIGETIKWDNENYQVIGVVKNMVMESPYDPVRQTVYSLKNEKLSFILIKINPSVNAAAAISNIQSVFRKYAPSSPFEYKFIDEVFADKFATENRIGKLSSFFAALAIFISCLGLFGMASFMAEQRTKEIGVRKVLGASVLNVWQLLSKDFVLLVFISLLIASPLAYYFMHEWLQNYQYRITISGWSFILAGLSALLITLMVVSFQAIKAATANPVKSLRTE